MQIHFVGRDHDKIVDFENNISIREALTMANVQPSTVIVSLDDNILPHSTLIKSDITLKVTTVSSGG
jgi:sulfur carrier protein ThiS